ncbi:three-Cys-motif partner protein TcmP [Cytophagaceae bacterium DM2B3-1]|uniref:Three-Cys-motif partner protein TcmP n=1 Tax=Xanthocytophaga flava TaxID=3048013 RepID=A0ABT7CS38_9BACT|nr:three-Cys-motif partner protein TcmP [Xanthocytophaga flavus]MDJ1496564.1 three-Cys-motif partner protein TcmP [Xanthocytophaga flavus]
MEKRIVKVSTEVGFSTEHEMKPHSQAKVALYESYLEKYLAIISAAKFFTKINIFDVFCGAGVYKNGKVGSPVVAHQAILKTKQFLLTNLKKDILPVSLSVNDGNPDSIEQVKEVLTQMNTKDPCCELSFFNLEAEAMFEIILKKLPLQDNGVRNLILIDPTGYKEIYRGDIYNLLQYRNSEIILFLPISFMYRFKDAVQKDYENPSYVHLRRFINEFFPEDHPVRKNLSMDVFQFMDYLTEQLTFDNVFFTSSFFLESEAHNYYALFFITPSILGLERIIDTKWKIDSKTGSGFRFNTTSCQMTLLPDFMYDQKIQTLQKSLLKYISDNPECNNIDLYKFTLNLGFRPPHTVEILKKLQKEDKLEVWDVNKAKVSKNAFYLNYECFKAKTIKVTYKLL